MLRTVESSPSCSKVGYPASCSASPRAKGADYRALWRLLGRDLHPLVKKTFPGTQRNPVLIQMA